MALVTSIWGDLERFLQLDPNKRGFAGKTSPGSLELAALGLSRARKVAIATGFYIPGASAIESDGPLGAVFLARALSQLGKDAALLVPVAGLAACTATLPALNFPCRVVPMVPGQVVDTFISDFGCDVFVAIEYPGQGVDGECRNMRGTCISPHVPRLDRALEYARQQGVFTLAIGDGGNELGCGALAKEVAFSPCGQTIAAISEADAVLAAGISNWGAYTLVAALSLVEKANLLPTALGERHLLERLCSMGVVDGCSMKCEQSVDGVGVEQLGDFLQGLNKYVKENIEAERQVAASS